MECTWCVWGLPSRGGVLGQPFHKNPLQLLPIFFLCMLGRLGFLFLLLLMFICLHFSSFLYLQFVLPSPLSKLRGPSLLICSPSRALFLRYWHQCWSLSALLVWGAVAGGLLMECEGYSKKGRHWGLYVHPPLQGFLWDFLQSCSRLWLRRWHEELKTLRRHSVLIFPFHSFSSVMSERTPWPWLSRTWM